jgi:hypothetical protein
MTEKMVQVYDSTSKQTVTIPARELAPGMVLTETVGQAGAVWQDASTLTTSTTLRHPPLPELRPLFAWFSRVFAVPYPNTPESWELGFRGDVNYGKEVFNWVHVAEVFEQMTAGRPKNADREQELLLFLLACMNSGPDIAQCVTSRRALTDKAVREATALWQKLTDPDLREVQGVYTGWKAAHPGASPNGELNDSITAILKRYIARRYPAS